MQGDAAKIGFMAMPLLSRVLEQMQPADFQSYAEFTASCNSYVTSIGHIAERLVSLPPCMACIVDSSSEKVKAHMARVRGCLRRTQEPEEKYFSTAENAGLATDHSSASCSKPVGTCIAPVDLGSLQAGDQDMTVEL